MVRFGVLTRHRMSSNQSYAIFRYNIKYSCYFISPGTGLMLSHLHIASNQPSIKYKDIIPCNFLIYYPNLYKFYPAPHYAYMPLANWAYNFFNFAKEANIFFCPAVSNSTVTSKSFPPSFTSFTVPEPNFTWATLSPGP